MTYSGGSRSGEPRLVTPLQIIHGRESDYLVAFCHEEEKRKQYRIDRIELFEVNEKVTVDVSRETGEGTGG